MTAPDYDAIAARAEAHPDALWIPAEPMDGGPYHDDTNGSYVKAWVRNSPVGSGFLISVSLSQSVDVPALLARCRDLEAENEAWQSVVLTTTHERDDARAAIDTETLAAACRTAAVSSAHADLLNAVAARMLAMRSWIDGAKVDLDGYDDARAAIALAGEEIERASAEVRRADRQRDDARAAIDRVRALHVDEWVVIDYVGGYVCRECREPVESEPCATIRALDGGATDPQTQEGP